MNFLIYAFLFLCPFSEDIKPGDPRSHHLPIEPHHSLRFPFDTSLQHWHYGGHAVATTDLIRLTPNIQSRSGWLFNEFDLQSDSWELEIKFSAWATHHIGGDGLAFWILHNDMHPSNAKENDWSWLTGPLFGMRDDFNGIGIVLDTYDNDGMRDNPRIFVLKNDGSQKKWNHDNDFKDDMIPADEGQDVDSNSCTMDIRQRGKYWSTHLHRMLIRYISGVLHVYIDTEKRASDVMAEYKYCLSVSLGDFTTKGTHHVAATALTGQGDVADTHDIHHIGLRYLDSSDDVIDDSRIGRGSSSKVGGYFSLILNLVNMGVLGYLLYDMVSQLINFHKAKMEQINPHFVCTSINKQITGMYTLYFAQFLVFLVWGDWSYVFLNTPLMGLRGFRFMTDSHKLHAAELMKASSFSLNRKTLGYFECTWLFVLLVACFRNVIGY